MVNYYERRGRTVANGSGGAVVVNYLSVFTAGSPFLARGAFLARLGEIARRSTRRFSRRRSRIYRSAGKRPSISLALLLLVLSLSFSFVPLLIYYIARDAWIFRPARRSEALSQRAIVLKDVSSRPARAPCARGARSLARSFGGPG